MLPPRIARLAGLGAFGAAAGIVALFILWAVLVTRPTQYSGLDGTLRAVTWIALAGVVLALVAIHVVLGRRLLGVARGDTRL